MTKEQSSGTGSDEVERRDHAAFVDSLANALDLRGGLGDALNVADYTAMSSHIANLLDLEAGLQSALAKQIAQTNPDQANAEQQELDRVPGERAQSAASRSLKTPLATRTRFKLVVRPRRLLSACVVAAVFTAVMIGIGMMVTSTVVTLLLPFVAAGFSVAGLAATRSWIERLDQRLTPALTPESTSALTHHAAAVQTDSLKHDLTGLAQSLADATRAQCAAVWLAVAEKLVNAASYPPGDDLPARTTTLAALLAQPDVDYAVPVLDGSVLRAALTISKPGRPVTSTDQRIMHNIAQGAGLLLRGAHLTAELEERVRRADELAAQLQASRQRLTRAREVQRRRLVSELTQVRTTQLATLRQNVAEIQKLVSSDQTGSERTQQALAQARTGLDTLLDRFRIIARGVYPAVLPSQGPAGALEDLATDLPRPVQVSGQPPQRLSNEVESGIYWLAASAMQHLAAQPAEQPLHVHLEYTKDRLAVHIRDPIATEARDILAELTDDVDRLAALGGDVEIISYGESGIALRAWLPDQPESLVGVS